ncbi:T9SS type A sorting domain-containing protein [Flavobacterium sp.]|uniref:T9SS type A sorting domain-containing protein n=1 Tax=Flavobacterium sp. TaxID=239 RepID=UPI002B4B20BF|nr:T9SS type A sorting domain-containing protein [Flavobacterium sp.]HLP63964.1 T9SS type A sorting domain-containing protein [Flavobacterium sp.]
MKQLSLFFVLVSLCTSAQVLRVEPQDFSSVISFGKSGSFNDNEIAVMGNTVPNVISKLYLFNMGTEITPNGLLDSPETNQNFDGGIEMTNDFLFIGSTTNNTNVTNGGAVYVYKKVSGNWNYLLKLQPTTQSENNRFGSNIAFHDGQLFVTASGYDSNGSSTLNNGGVYHYYLIQNDTFAHVGILSGNEADFGFGDLLEFENNKMVTTSDGSTTDTVYTYQHGNVSWGLLNTLQMPVFTEFNVNVKASDRVSFSNGKLYMYHYDENTADPFLFGKRVKIYNWSDNQFQWNFSENFSFQEGDYLEYKVKVRGTNMYLIPVGWYILQMERKNPAFHYQFNGTSWNYVGLYKGMSSFDNDDFGYFTVAKGNKVLFGNSTEKWSQFTSWNGGAYMVDSALSADEFDNQNVLLFPNPTNGIISIASPNAQLTQVELFDSLGKSILIQNFNFETIDVSSLSSGIYLCKITDNFGRFETKKIIKN